MKIKDLFNCDISSFRISQEWGVPWIKNPGIKHNGVDIAGAKFTALCSMVNGHITRASYHFKSPIYSFGNRISILFATEKESLELYLAHLDGMVVKVDNFDILRGHFLGRMGSTGSSTGTHVHLGIRDKSGRWLNPHDYIDFGALK